MKKTYKSAAELVASVATLLTLPDVYQRVKDVVQDPDSCLSDLVNAISIDPGIVARVLRLVNSAYFNLGVPVSNIRQAVNILGMKALHDLVLTTTLVKTFSQSDQSALNARGFWEDSVRRAVFARLIAKQCNERHPERLFLMGLLCDIGHQLMYWQMPRQTRQALELSKANGIPLTDAESELLGYNYADVGGELLRSWELPENLTAVVSHHHQPLNAPVFAKEAAIVHLAHALTGWHHGLTDDALKLASLNAEILSISGISAEYLLQLRELAAEELAETIGIFLGNSIAA